MNRNEILAAREQRRKIVEDMRNLDRAAADFEAKFEAMDAEQEKLRKNIEREERLETVAAELAETRAPGRPAVTPAEDRAALQKSAFERYFRYGYSNLSDIERRALGNPERDTEHRDSPQTVTTTGGGYLIPTGFVAELEVAQKAFGAVENVARVITTSTGNTLPFPKMNDTTNKGRLLGINSAITAGGLTFDNTNLGAYKFSSDYVLVPSELLQDSAIPVEQIIAQAFAERLARIKNEYFTVGTGSSQPSGVVTGSTKGADAANAGSIVYNDFVDLEHGLDRAYRTGARWMFHDSTLKAAKKLIDSYGRPLWTSGLAFKEPDSILGYPYEVNNDMAEISSTESPVVQEKTILFGNFNKYLVRRVRPFTLRRLDELNAGSDQVTFIAFERADGALLDAGTHPIVHLLMKAS